MFQDGSCECPKLNHRRRRRAQSETHGGDDRCAAPASALGQEVGYDVDLRRAGRDERVRVSLRLPSDTRSVTPRGLHNAEEAKTPGGHLHRDRTGRDVLLREKCTPSPERYVRAPCAPPRRTHRCDARAPRNDDESLRSFIRVSQVYPWTVSRTVELSLQSSFQLSLTVLVRYRSRGNI